jgi:hypothetical protein
MRHTSLESANKSRKSVEFLVGDEIVVRRNHAKGIADRKWGPLFSNPHNITRIISDVCVETIDEFGQTHRLHVDRIKRYKRPPLDDDKSDEELPNIDESLTQSREIPKCNCHCNNPTTIPVIPHRIPPAQSALHVRPVPPPRPSRSQIPLPSSVPPPARHSNQPDRQIHAPDIPPQRPPIHGPVDAALATAARYVANRRNPKPNQHPDFIYEPVVTRSRARNQNL